MLSYRHGFHAGNFADVYKHVILTVLLAALRRKAKPFVYLDTHAGAGRYDLRSEMARKNREHESGIVRLWEVARSPTPLPAAVGTFLDCVRAINPVRGGAASSPAPRRYPGSPRVARQLLRPRDRMLLAELHGSEIPLLRREFAGDRQVQVFAEDGYHLLRSKLPPREHRGLVLIDPAYERRDEVAHVLQGVADGHRRFATGVFAVWYPIMPKIAVRKLQQGIAAAGIRKVLVAELCVFPDDNPLGINGSGMIVVNPPWQSDEELRAVTEWLWPVLSPQGLGRRRVEWLVPE
jgi:23S rRNA (adenine2030-N6)-methyltransferase